MKANKQFAILSAIGIIMVVASHCDRALNLFNDIFPYTSFFMPMFMFISGYFFKDENVHNIRPYLKKKFFKLLVYYFVWNLIYGIITWSLYNVGLCAQPKVLGWETLIYKPFIDGQQYGFSASLWFIPTLFTVEIAFLIVRKLQLKCKYVKIVDYISFIILVSINIFSVYIAKKGITNEALIPILKLAFFMVFFQGGKIYKEYLENKDLEIPTLMVFGITISINVIIIGIYKNINFPSLYNMKDFSYVSPIIPIVVAATGIWFWLRISKILEKSLGDNKIINKISDHTKDIMAHHIFLIWLANLVLYLLKDLIGLKGFNSERFIATNGWYRYYPEIVQFELIYIFIGIWGSLKISDIEKIVLKKLHTGVGKWKKLKKA